MLFRSGVRPGVGVEYAGFPIGRVEEVGLSPAGEVHIRIHVAREYTQWIRADSQFALEQPIVGTPRIVVETASRKEPELPSGALRTLRTSKQMDEVMAKGLGIAFEEVMLRFDFSDGHRTGLYSFDYLRRLAGLG